MPLISTLEGFLEDEMSRSGLAALFPAGMLKESLMVAGGAAGMSALATLATLKIEYLDTDEHLPAVAKRVILDVLLGVGGGALLWRKYRPLAHGVIGGMGARLGYEATAWLLGKLGETAGMGRVGQGTDVEEAEAEAALESVLHGMGQLPEETMLGDSTRIETEQVVAGRQLAASIAVEEESPGIAGWMGGY